LKDSWANIAELDETNMDLNELLHSEDAFKWSSLRLKGKLKGKEFNQAKTLMQPGLRLILNLLNEVHLLEFKGFG
jgi:hypothetical protein